MRVPMQASEPQDQHVVPENETRGTHYWTENKLYNETTLKVFGPFSVRFSVRLESMTRKRILGPPTGFSVHPFFGPPPQWTSKVKLNYKAAPIHAISLRKVLKEMCTAISQLSSTSKKHKVRPPLLYVTTLTTCLFLFNCKRAPDICNLAPQSRWVGGSR